MTKIEPLGFYALIKPLRVEEKTAGGVYLPDSIKEKEQHAMARGEIVGVGEGAPSLAKYVGRIALFGRYAGVTIEESGEEYRLIDAQDVRGVI